MAVAWRRDPRPSLETHPWRVISLGEPQAAQDYLVKAKFDEGGYHVMLTDSCAVWEENIDSNKIQERLNSLNPNVEAPLTVLQSTLSVQLESQQAGTSYIISPHPAHHTTPHTLPDQFFLTIETSLASLPLEWKFYFKKCTQEEISTHLVNPLLSMVGELLRRQRELCAVITKKDKEIEDFREQGHTVTRKYIETTPFFLKAFENEMITSSEFERTAQEDMKVFSASPCQQIYKDISMVKKWMLNKDDAPPLETGGLEGTDTTGTWADKLPASLLPSVPSLQAHKSPHTSPLKTFTTASPDVSPSKDGERLRREALEKRLNEDKNKAKRKKRKLM